jgi:hypothetical protein
MESTASVDHSLTVVHAEALSDVAALKKQLIVFEFIKNYLNFLSKILQGVLYYFPKEIEVNGIHIVAYYQGRFQESQNHLQSCEQLAKKISISLQQSSQLSSTQNSDLKSCSVDFDTKLKGLDLSLQLLLDGLKKSFLVLKLFFVSKHQHIDFINFFDKAVEDIEGYYGQVKKVLQQDNSPVLISTEASQTFNDQLNQYSDDLNQFARRHWSLFLKFFFQIHTRSVSRLYSLALLLFGDENYLRSILKFWKKCSYLFPLIPDHLKSTIQLVPTHFQEAKKHLKLGVQFAGGLPSLLNQSISTVDPEKEVEDKLNDFLYSLYQDRFQLMADVEEILEVFKQFFLHRETIQSFIREADLLREDFWDLSHQLDRLIQKVNLSVAISAEEQNHFNCGLAQSHEHIEQLFSHYADWFLDFFFQEQYFSISRVYKYVLCLKSWEKTLNGTREIFHSRNYRCAEEISRAFKVKALLYDQKKQHHLSFYRQVDGYFKALLLNKVAKWRLAPLEALKKISEKKLKLCKSLALTESRLKRYSWFAGFGSAVLRVFTRNIYFQFSSRLEGAAQEMLPSIWPEISDNYRTVAHGLLAASLFGMDSFWKTIFYNPLEPLFFSSIDLLTADLNPFQTLGKWVGWDEESVIKKIPAVQWFLMLGMKYGKNSWIQGFSIRAFCHSSLTHITSTFFGSVSNQVMEKAFPRSSYRASFFKEYVLHPLSYSTGDGVGKVIFNHFFS